MMVVTEAEAAVIRAAFEQRGELSAAVELRRLFPAITDTVQARACARTIAGWKPLPVPLHSEKRRDPGRIGSATLLDLAVPETTTPRLDGGVRDVVPRT
jgi:hypothetical protein